MKKSLITILAALATVAIVAEAQQLQVVTNTVMMVSVPAVTWAGGNAQLIAAQLAAITNSDGTVACPVFVSANPGGYAFSLRLHFGIDANGQPVVDSVTVEPK